MVGMERDGRWRRVLPVPMVRSGGGLMASMPVLLRGGKRYGHRRRSEFRQDWLWGSRWETPVGCTPEKKWSPGESSVWGDLGLNASLVCGTEMANGGGRIRRRLGGGPELGEGGFLAFLALWWSIGEEGEGVVRSGSARAGFYSRARMPVARKPPWKDMATGDGVSWLIWPGWWGDERAQGSYWSRATGRRGRLQPARPQ